MELDNDEDRYRMEKDLKEGRSALTNGKRNRTGGRKSKMGVGSA